MVKPMTMSQSGRPGKSQWVAVTLSSRRARETGRFQVRITSRGNSEQHQQLMANK